MKRGIVIGFAVLALIAVGVIVAMMQRKPAANEEDVRRFEEEG
jgi:hypothetical protein